MFVPLAQGQSAKFLLELREILQSALKKMLKSLALFFLMHALRHRRL